MELNDILTLVKAGYTREEIEKMSQPLGEPVPVATPAQDSEPVPAQVAEPVVVAEPVPESVTTEAKEQPTMQDILQSIARLTSAVQANAIAQSVLPDGMKNQPTAEDMLAEIIRPTYKERG